MSRQKTLPTKISPSTYLNSLADPAQKKDAKELIKIFQEATKEKPVMWGASIVGFGAYHYKYASGHEGDAPLTGFSARKGNFSLYIMPGVANYADLLKKLGPHKKAVACLYIKKLSDVHIPTLKTLIKKSHTEMKKNWKK